MMKTKTEGKGVGVTKGLIELFHVQCKEDFWYLKEVFPHFPILQSFFFLSLFSEVSEL